MSKRSCRRSSPSCEGGGTSAITRPWPEFERLRRPAPMAQARHAKIWASVRSKPGASAYPRARTDPVVDSKGRGQMVTLLDVTIAAVPLARGTPSDIVWVTSTTAQLGSSHRPGDPRRAIQRPEERSLKFAPKACLTPQTEGQCPATASPRRASPSRY